MLYYLSYRACTRTLTQGSILSSPCIFYYSSYRPAHCIPWQHFMFTFIFNYSSYRGSISSVYFQLLNIFPHIQQHIYPHVYSIIVWIIEYIRWIIEKLFNMNNWNYYMGLTLYIPHVTISHIIFIRYVHGLKFWDFPY